MYTSRNSYSSRTPSSPTSIRTRRRTGTSARQPRRPARSRRPTRASGRALQAGCQLASRRGAMRQLHLEAARSGGARRARRRRAASGHERRRWLRGQRRKECGWTESRCCAAGLHAAAKSSQPQKNFFRIPTNGPPMSSLSSLACGIAGFLYPAFRSFKAIRDDGCADGVQCAPHPSSPSVRLPHTAFLATGLTYWVTFALFRCVESLLDFFIGWLPLYYELKLVFILWLMLPPVLGAKYLCVDSARMRARRRYSTRLPPPPSLRASPDCCAGTSRTSSPSSSGTRPMSTAALRRSSRGRASSKSTTWGNSARSRLPRGRKPSRSTGMPRNRAAMTARQQRSTSSREEAHLEECFVRFPTKVPKSKVTPLGGWAHLARGDRVPMPLLTSTGLPRNPHIY